MQLEKLRLSEKNLFMPYLERLRYIDTGFTSLYYVAESFNVRCGVIGETLAVSFDLAEHTAYTLFGTGALAQAAAELEQDGCVRFMCVPEDELEAYCSLPGYTAETSYNAAYSDYICRRDDFVALKSRNGHRKCKDYSRFTRNNSYVVRELCEENLGDVRVLLERWCAARSCADCKLGCEKSWIFRLLDAWSELPAKGLIVDIDGCPQGFAIAELCGDTMLRLVGKPVGRQEGLHVFLGIQTALRLFPEAKFVNSGADLGLPGLALMKQKFKPYELVHKYDVTLKRC